MKNLSHMAKKLYPIHDIEEGMLFTLLASPLRNEWIELTQPTLGQYLSCPDCGSTVGYHVIVIDPPRNGWSCKQDACIENSGRWDRPSLKNNAPVIPKYVPQNLPGILKDAKFKQCTQLVAYKNEWKEWVKNGSDLLLFHGTIGTGKSYAACALVNAYCLFYARGSGRVTYVQEIYEAWRSASLESQGTERLGKELLNIDLLVLDDMGINVPTDGFLGFLSLLISKRTDEPKPTIITTNMTYQAACDKWGDAIASRLMSAKRYQFTGKDRRNKQNFMDI